MKKLAAIFMALAVAISCASFACVSAEEATEAAPQEEITLGGWTAPESPEITTSLFLGRVTSTFFKLCSLAPLITICPCIIETFSILVAHKETIELHTAFQLL